jgi:2'-5' RNA ligase
VLHVPLSGLETVAEAVVRATEKIGKPPEPRPFKGHLTLARAQDRRRGVDLRPLVGTPVSAEWQVTEVCLVESRLNPKGAQYEVVETVLLASPP